MRSLANEFAPHLIRVNTIYPSSVDTKMIQNEAIWSAFAPGVENPTVADFGDTFTAMNLLPIPWMEPEAISGAVAWLASDDANTSPAPPSPSTPATSANTTDPPGRADARHPCRGAGSSAARVLHHRQRRRG